MTKFDNCCDEIVVDPDCPCTDDVPAGLTTLSHTFDVNAGDASWIVSAVAGTVDYTCCDGDTQLKVVSLNNPDNLPIVMTSPSTTTDGSYNFSIDFDADGVTDDTPTSSVMTVNMTVCNGTYTIKLNIQITITDTCTDTVPSSLSPIAQALELNATDDTVYSHPVTMGTLACCNGDTIEIIGLTDLTNRNTGVTWISPNVGDIISGNTVTFQYLYQPYFAQAQTFAMYIEMKLCDNSIVTQVINWTISDTGVDVLPNDPAPTVNESRDLYTEEGIFSTVITFGTLNCKEPYDTIEAVTIVPEQPPVNTGVTIIEPRIGEQVNGNQITLRYSFDPNVAVDSTSETVDFMLMFCDRSVIKQPVVFAVTDSCVQVIPGTQSEKTQNYDISNEKIVYDTETTGSLSYTCCGDVDPDIVIVGVLDASDANTGLTIENIGARFTGTSFEIDTKWDPDEANFALNQVVNVTVKVCEQTFLQPIRVITAAAAACGVVNPTGGPIDTTVGHYIGDTTGTVNIPYSFGADTVDWSIKVIWNDIVQDEDSGSGTGSGTLSFSKGTATSGMLFIVIKATGAGATHDYTVNCPV